MTELQLKMEIEHSVIAKSHFNVLFWDLETAFWELLLESWVFLKKNFPKFRERR